ncbi:MAG: hypothetical protein J6K77_07360 [Ruminococcus sp.]|nr:hypothetical protein [Ruminococcus sp.]
MKQVKRTIAGILAMMFVISAVGCGKDEKKEKKEATKASEVIKNSYNAVEIGEKPPMEYIDNIQALGDTGKFLVSGSDTTGICYFITDSEFIDYQSVDLSEIAEGHEGFSAVPLVMADGSIYVTVTYTDYEEGAVVPDYEDPDFDWENFDYDALEEATITSYYIYQMNETGEILSKNEVGDVGKYVENNDETGRIWLGNASALGNDTIVFSVSGMNEESYIAVGTDGNVIGKLDLGDNVYLYNGTVNDKDGNLLFTTYDDDDKEVIAKIDAKTMTLSDDKISIGDTNAYLRGLYRGNEEYPILAAGNSVLYGVTPDNEIKELINWVDSDITGDNVSGVFPAENGEYIIYVDDWSDNTQRLYRLTERDPSELENATIINMVVSYNDTDTSKMIQKFNQENKDYRIRVEEYGKYYEWDDEKEINTNTPAKQLQSDLAAGKDVDIIMINDSALTQNLGNKGALADMYEFMGKDGSPAKDEFVDSVLAGMETDGKLYAMPINFSVQTTAIKSKYFSEENWTVDDMIETYNNMPEGCTLYQYGDNSKERAFSALASGGSSFLDYKNGTCSFDSPDFIKILEFANRFEDRKDDDFIFDSPEKEQSWYEEQELALRNDKAMLYDMWLDEPREYKRARDGYFGDDITLVGMPSSDGSGALMQVNNSISILSSSPSKEACWKFVSQYLTEEQQSGDNIWGLPVLKSAFEKKLDALMEKPYWTDEDGKKQEYDDQVYIGSQEIKIEPFTQEERDYIENYILNAKFSNYYYDEEIQAIINEEVQAYFAGEKSAQDAADLIQNRVSILISEKS